MSQGESQLSHILHAAERWANQTDEHSVEEHTGQTNRGSEEPLRDAVLHTHDDVPKHCIFHIVLLITVTLEMLTNL